MLKVLGLVLTAGLLLSFTACSGDQASNLNKNQNQNQNLNRNQKSNGLTSSEANTNTTSATNTSAAPTAPMTATVKNDGFSWKDDASGTPVTTVKVGGTITWTITSGTHSLARVAGPGCDELPATFKSEKLGKGKSVTIPFPTAGTFGYHCGIHMGDPDCKTPPGDPDSGMPGVIKVVP